jgi:coenzyme F420 hydrogenase subunit beta
MNFRRVDDVVEWRLCTGCGACVAICPQHSIQLVDIRSDGLRPVINSDKCLKCGKCVSVCPGIATSHQEFNDKTIPQLRQAWGPVLEVWEGYAADSEIRFEGSSGGAATALALYCLEKGSFDGVLHIGAKPEKPAQNTPIFSKSREELIKHTGSRYSPAGPCEKLIWIEESGSPCVFIGKPCDVVALRKSQDANPNLEGKVGLAISIFCAGTPSTDGTYKLLSKLCIEPDGIEGIRYRGRGWPGMTTVKIKNNNEIRQMTYEEAWGGILNHYSQFRCRLCPDSTGEFADISCGDPWYREIPPNEQGRSLVLVRTERGREILAKAQRDGYLTIEPAVPDVLPRSQKSLLSRREQLWGRLLAMRVMLVPTPHFEGFSLFSSWRSLSLKEKLRSVMGTIKRIVQRGWMISTKSSRYI